MMLAAESLPRLSRLSFRDHHVDLEDFLKVLPDYSNVSPVQPLTGLQCLTVSMPLHASSLLDAACG